MMKKKWHGLTLPLAEIIGTEHSNCDKSTSDILSNLIALTDSNRPAIYFKHFFRAKSIGTYPKVLCASGIYNIRSLNEANRKHLTDILANIFPLDYGLLLCL